MAVTSIIVDRSRVVHSNAKSRELKGTILRMLSISYYGR